VAGNPAIASYASAGGRAKARRRITLDHVRAELRLDSPEAIRAGLQLVQQWTACGMLTGTAANAAVRAGEVALKALEASTTFEAIEALRGDLAELRAERDALAQQVEQLQLAARKTA
jgi:ethanolamine utilization microcompartment shell protein EutS